MIQAQHGILRVLAHRYETEELIGSGATGEVFRARDLVLGETVAVKVLRVDAHDFVGMLARFRQEVRLARRVTHKNVARVFDIVEDGELLLLTMEYVEGETLESLLTREKLPLPRAVRIARAVCAGLAAVHDAGIVLRDLKPSNILLERPTELGGDPRVVLADFGVARSTIEVPSTRAVVVGTPRYMAPEQARGMAVDVRADIYSLGVVLGEMVAESDTSTGYSEIVNRCCAASVDERPRSADEIARALDAIDRRSDVSLSLAPVSDESAESSARSERSVVVMPFRVTTSPGNDPPDAALGDAIAEQLTDVLCTLRGLRVVASGAARRFANQRDPERIHDALSVDAMIDGTVRIEGDRVHITARLIETPSGDQRWHETFEGSFSELFSFESTIAKRVAEQLRLRVTLMVFDEGVPAEAVRLYLDASVLRERPLNTDVALGLLDRAVAIHPRFAPALSQLALRSLVAWYVPFVHTPPDFGETCARRVASALEGAPSLAETHVAAAVLLLEQGKAREAERALERALQLAPTCIEALNVLGELQCQAGRQASGLVHARRAFSLDARAVMPLVTVAREEAFDGRLDACMALLDALGDDAWTPPAFLLRVRAAAWLGAPDVIREWRRRGAGMGDASGRFLYGETVARAFLRETDEGEIDALVDGLLAIGKSPRFAAETLRIGAEVSAVNGRREGALARLRALGELPAFVDVGWLDRCPALRPLANEPAFVAARDAAWRRALALA